MWRKVSHVINLQSFGKRLCTSKMRLTKETPRLFGEEFHTLIHIFLCIENVNGLQVQNGHIEFSMALAKLVGIVPILVCQIPFYKTSSIPKLWSWHIPLFDIITMLFGCFMGLLMVFIDFNLFWIEYDKWGHFIMRLVGPFHIPQGLTIWYNLYWFVNVM